MIVNNTITITYTTKIFILLPNNINKLNIYVNNRKF